MPGKCVSHVNRESKLIGQTTETSERGRQLRRSSSLLRNSSRSSNMRSSSQSPADGRTQERGRSVSVTRRTRSASVGVSGRESLSSSSGNIAQRSTSASRGRSSSSVEDVKKDEGCKFKSSNHRHTKSMTAIETDENVKTISKTDDNAYSKEFKSSYRDRALEFTQKVIEDSGDNGRSQAIVPIEKTELGAHQADTDDFDESDPIIMIPTIHLDDASLPPPPPRSFEEMEIHERRQELRRNQIRHQRRERTMSGDKLNANLIKQQMEEKNSRSPRRQSSLKNIGNQYTGMDPATELRKIRRDGNKQSASIQCKLPDFPTPVSTKPVHPSLAVLTALENHRQKVKDDESEITPPPAVGKHHLRQSRKSSHVERDKVVTIQNSADVGKDGPGENVDADVESETSSISTASAKQYRMQPEPAHELHSRHPELKGVDSDLHKFPPVNVTLDRARSRSKSRPVDAPEENGMQLAVYDKTNKRSSSTRGSGSEVRNPSSKVEVEKKSSHDQDAAIFDKKRGMKHSPRMQRLKPSASSRSHHRENSKVHPDETSPARKILTTSSSVRVSKHQESKHVSRSLSSRVRDASGRDLSEKRTSKSVERFSSLANNSPALMDGKQRRSKSSVTSRRERSPHTSSTQPESLYSDDLLRKKSAKEGPVVIHKKRATRRSPKDERRETVDSSDGVKPVTAIRYSEDERSHASSISAGSRSTLEESLHSDGEGEKHADVREKAISVLKGGAKNLAIKGRGALGGLKDTSKKWQSALFV